MRIGKCVRVTSETDITLTIDLDGQGEARLDTPIGFLQHMLQLFCCHSGFDIEVSATGDSEVDYHHLTEDIGICLGKAFSEAIGTKAGSTRYGQALLPMDESLVLIAVDLSGRPYLHFEAEMPTAKVGVFDSELVEEFWRGFVNEAGLTLHIILIHGRNTHHVIEAIFKGVARALCQAVGTRRNSATVPSSKGVL